jgi:hypothetical protein
MNIAQLGLKLAMIANIAVLNNAAAKVVAAPREALARPCSTTSAQQQMGRFGALALIREATPQASAGLG